jgi:hypothetical protein
LFTFIWFFVVPMPGLLVFTAPGGFRISVSPGAVLNTAMGVLAAVLGAYLLSLALDWWERDWHQGGLADRIQLQYRFFQSVTHQLSPLQNSRLYAMFTDVQTYFDQQSYAYARRSLSAIERALKGATDRQLEDNAG